MYKHKYKWIWWYPHSEIMMKNFLGITGTTYKYLISRNSGQPPYSDKSKLSFNFNLTAYRGYQTFNFRQFLRENLDHNNHFKRKKSLMKKNFRLNLVILDRNFIKFISKTWAFISWNEIGTGLDRFYRIWSLLKTGILKMTLKRLKFWPGLDWFLLNRVPNPDPNPKI